MNVKIQIEGSREALAKLRQYAELTGNGIETGVKEIGVASARALASKVQPFGFKKIDKFQASIEAQVKRAIRNANVQGATGSIANAHKSRRNSKGQVSKELTTKGRYPSAPFDPQQRAALQKRKADNAGMAKGAWIEAGNKLVTVASRSRRALKKINVTQVIMRHADKGHGMATLARSGINLTIYLTNKLSYIRRTMKNSHVQSALKSGLLNGYKRIDAHIKRETKKLSSI
jgi:hypothetical protein